MEITELFLSFSLIGGIWVLYLLLALSILSVAVIVERTIYFFSNRAKPKDFKEQLLVILLSGQLDEARKLSESATGPEARSARLALSSVNDRVEIVDQKLMANTLKEQKLLEKRLLILGTLGNNAPFIGLLGTVLGIIRAFYDLSIAGAGGPSVVMVGIAEALVATAMGLFIAIPAVIAYNYFQHRTRQIRQELEQFHRSILSYLHANSGRGTD